MRPSEWEGLVVCKVSTRGRYASKKPRGDGGSMTRERRILVHGKHQLDAPWELPDAEHSFRRNGLGHSAHVAENEAKPAGREIAELRFMRGKLPACRAGADVAQRRPIERNHRFEIADGNDHSQRELRRARVPRVREH